MKLDTEKNGKVRTIWIDGKAYTMRYLDSYKSEDQWRYTLPDGETYSHPTEFGALLMILKAHAGGEYDRMARQPMQLEG